jgi:hypothetical protein
MTSWPAALVPILLISLLTLLLVVFLLASIKNLPSTKVRTLVPIFLILSHPSSGDLLVGNHQEPSLQHGELALVPNLLISLLTIVLAGCPSVGLFQEPQGEQGELALVPILLISLLTLLLVVFLLASIKNLNSSKVRVL